MPVKETLSEIRLAKASLQLLPGNVVRIEVYKDAHIELEDIRQIQEAREKMVGNAPYSILNIAGKYSNITTEAREYAVRKEVIRNRVALAIVISSLAQRIIGNFFVKSHQPGTPARIFNSEDEAIKWLKKYATEK